MAQPKNNSGSTPSANGNGGATAGRPRRQSTGATLRQQDLLDRAARHIRLGSGSARIRRS